VAKGRAGEASAADGEGFAIIFKFSPFGAPPLALREIGVLTKFESRKIDSILLCFGKIDAFESYTRVFVGVPPFVLFFLAFLREDEKESLMVGPGLSFGGSLIIRYGLVLVRHAWFPAPLH
jgi:hypothetical protein